MTDIFDCFVINLITSLIILSPFCCFLLWLFWLFSDYALINPWVFVVSESLQAIRMNNKCSEHIPYCWTLNSCNDLRRHFQRRFSKTIFKEWYQILSTKHNLNANHMLVSKVPVMNLPWRNQCDFIVSCRLEARSSDNYIYLGLCWLRLKLTEFVIERLRQRVSHLYCKFEG